MSEARTVNFQHTILQAVATQYRLDIQPSPAIRQGGAVNHVLRVSTGNRDVIVRIHPPESDPGRLVAVHAVQAQLRKRGLPIPAFQTTPSGATFIRSGDRIVEVMEFIPGGHEVSTWDEAVVRSRSLGHLHREFRAISSDAVPPLRRVWNHPPETSRSILDDTEAAFRSREGAPGFDEATDARIRARRLLCELSHAWSRYEPAVPKPLIHGDFVGNNVLIEDGAVIAILDFDRLAPGMRIYELAYSLQAVLTRLVATGVRVPPPDHSLSDEDLEHLKHLVGSYEDASGWPLTAEERFALPFELARVPLYPIVMAAHDLTDVIGETLRYDAGVDLGLWLVAHATEFTGAMFR